MKNSLKKLVSLMTVFVMVLGLVPAMAATYSDVTEADAEAVQVLSAFKIIQGYEDGTFRGENTITRAEFAAVACRLIGAEDLSKVQVDTIFPDVSKEFWGSGYVQFAQQQGVINGFPDGNFYPDQPVTYEQAVKMVAAALGYNPFAMENGGYPTGYLYAAQLKGITKGVSGVVGQEATRSLVSNLAYNALEADLLKPTGFDNDGKVTYSFGGSALADFLEAEVIEKAVVTDTDVAKTGGSLAKIGQVNITPSTTSTPTAFNVGTSNVNDYAFRTVKVYTTTEKTSGLKTVLSVVPAVDTESLTVNAVLNSATPSPTHSYKYYASAEDKYKKTTTEVDMGAFGTITDFGAGTAATYTLVKDDDAAKYDLVIANKYSSIIVDKVDTTKCTVTKKGGGTVADLKFDSKSKNIFRLTDAKGNAVQPADLEKGDVVTYFAVTNGSDKIVTGFVTNDVVEGTIGKTVNSVVAIDDGYYVAATGVTGLDYGISGTFTLDAFGTIIDYKESKESKGDYAVIATSYSSGNETLFVWENGEKVELDIAKTVSVDGTNKNRSGDLGTANLAAGKLITYTMSGNEVTAIKTTWVTGSNEAGELKLNTATYTDAINGYDAEDAAFIGGDEDILASNVEEVIVNVGGAYYNIDFTEFEEDQVFTAASVDAYDVDPDDETIGCLVYTADFFPVITDLEMVVPQSIWASQGSGTELEFALTYLDIYGEEQEIDVAAGLSALGITYPTAKNTSANVTAAPGAPVLLYVKDGKAIGAKAVTNGMTNGDAKFVVVASGVTFTTITGYLGTNKFGTGNLNQGGNAILHNATDWAVFDYSDSDIVDSDGDAPANDTFGYYIKTDKSGRDILELVLIQTTV